MNCTPSPIQIQRSLAMTACLAAIASLWISSATALAQSSTSNSRPVLSVPRTDDFLITGRGEATQWNMAKWTAMHRRGDSGLDYNARFKMLYSSQGVYVLFDGSDSQLSATMTEDFADLWNEDVYECFFWTDEQHPVYFEYEISPLGYELPILVPKLAGEFLGWRPWHYEGERRIQKKVSATGGESKSNAKVAGWRAEVFIPYVLLKPLQNIPPKSGTTWRANFYRVDYDQDRQTAWDWSRVGPSFHEIENFGTLKFE